MTPEPIAIVGLGGVLPGAATLDDFWRVVEGGIDTASEPPAERWLLNLDLAYHPDRARADRVYSRRACFVRDFRLDPDAPNPEETRRLGRLERAGRRVAVRRRLAVGHVEQQHIVAGVRELGDGRAHAELLVIRMRADDEDVHD